MSRFVYTTSENVPEYMVKGGVVYRIVTDHLGSLKQVVNTQTGVVVQQMEHDEYGNVPIDTNPGFVPFGFAGGLFDAQTRLVRFGARDYDATVGRWTAKDPIRFEGRDVSLFGYCLSDPVGNSDVSGLVNYTKMQVALVNYIRGASTMNKGFMRMATSPRNSAKFALGAWNVWSGMKMLGRAQRQFSESLWESPDQGNPGNFLGLLPMGEKTDDPKEQLNLRDMIEGILEFIGWL